MIAAYLRDAAMEVIYTPPWQKIEEVVALALHEDVDVIGVSSLATDHLIVPDLMDALGDAGLGHIGVVVGGIVPDKEHPSLADAGVARIFGPGASRKDIVNGVIELGTRVRAAKLSEGDFAQ